MAENTTPLLSFETSPAINELAAALAKAQGVIQNAKKDHEAEVKMTAGGSYSYAYASLDGIWDAVRAPLSSNGLAVLQLPSVTPEGLLMTTLLAHSSGQFVQSRLLWPLGDRSAKGIGSAITYSRRYSLQAMVGVVAEEDDDGAAADAGDRKPKGRRQRPEEGDAPATNDAAPTHFPNFGRAKNAAIAGAAVADLESYLAAARKSLADPSKARWHAKESALIGAIEAELARQRNATPEGKRETKAAPAEPKKPAVVDQQDGESEEHAKMRTAGAFYAQAVRAGKDAGWSQEDVGKWLRKERNRGGRTEVTAEDVEIFSRHLDASRPTDGITPHEPPDAG